MPTYEYACKSCGEHLEVVQSFKDEALTVCPSCGGPLRKVFGNIGIAFKGSGFYKTDSRTGSSGSGGGGGGSAAKPAAASESSSAGSASSSSSTSSASSASSESSSSGSGSGSAGDAKAS